MSKYILLSNQNLSPRPVGHIWTWPRLEDLRVLLSAVPDGEIVAFDTETRGLDATHPDFCVVGLGLASASLEPCYFDLTQMAPLSRKYLLDWLVAQKLTAFNALFDGNALRRLTGRWTPFETDTYGLFRQFATEGWTGQRWNLEIFQCDILGWDVSNKTALSDALAERQLKKADMWQLPAEILGPYCALDAEAALQAHEYLVGFAEERFPEVMNFHRREYMTNLKLLQEQFWRGIFIHQNLLHKYHTDLCGRVQGSLEETLAMPAFQEFTAERQAAVMAERAAMEPPKVTKQGAESMRWHTWRKTTDRLVQDAVVNPASAKQMQELFYKRLGYAPVLMTASGYPSVGKKVLPLLGAEGEALGGYKKLSKEEGYVRAMVNKSSIDGLYHPQFNPFGTVSTRLAGTGGLNLQQVMKTPGYLRCIQARPGFKFAQLDLEAVEPVATTGFSKDPGMMKIYGPGAPKNDVYLFVAAQIPGLGDRIRKYYDPDNPTPEGIKAAKEHCKRDRSVAKIVVLSATYGCGVAKMHETFRLEGFDLSIEEVKKIHRAYWKLFAGVKRFGHTLQNIIAENGGWIYSGRGLPICVDANLRHDSLNRVIQGSCHQFLQTMLHHIDQIRMERRVPMFPVISDFHDETIWEVPTPQVEAATQVLIDGLARANEEWGLLIPIKGTPEIVDNLAEIKTENYEDYIRSLIEEEDEDDMVG